MTIPQVISLASSELERIRLKSLAYRHMRRTYSLPSLSVWQFLDEFDTDEMTQILRQLPSYYV